MYAVHRQRVRYIIVAVGSSGILKAKQKLGLTFNLDKQDVIDFTKFSNVQGLRSKFRKMVIDPLFFGQKKYKGLLFYQCTKKKI